MLLFVLQAVAANANATHKKVYAYFRSYNGTNDFGLASFYMDEPDKVDFLVKDGIDEGWFCGGVAKGIMYSCEYHYSTQEGPIPTGMWKYDLQTGEKTFVGHYANPNEGNPSLKFLDMTYDYTTETMYAVGFERGTPMLFTFDLNTAQATKVADLDGDVATLACNSEGQLYGIGQEGNLSKIDKNTGHCTVVFNTGYMGMFQSQSIEFDHTNGDLYWASNAAYPEERRDRMVIVKFNLKGEQVTMEDVCELPKEASMLALYIPFVKAGEAAPAAVGNLTITPGSNGVGTATLKWTNPTMTFGGNQLQNLKSISVKRDDQLVTTIETNEAGKAMEFTDDNVPNGKHHYTVYATNEVGDGEESYATVFVGFDSPAAPENVMLTPGDACASGILTWEAPTAGQNGGFFTGEGITYRIVRYPDNVEVAKDITATTFTDNKFRRLGRYHYKVYAVNAYGETDATTNTNVLGPALPIDEESGFVEDFSDLSYFNNRWTAIDGNHDQYTWTFNTTAPNYQFGYDGAFGAEYYVLPGFENKGLDADEWLISPPLSLKAAHIYEVTVSCRVLSDENFTVTIGNTNNIVDQTKVEDKVASVNYGPNDYPVPFTDYKVLLPKMQTDNVSCVGIHLTTPYPANNYAFIHLTSVTVKDVTSSGISETVETDTMKPQPIYNLNGQYVGTSLNGLDKGIYIRGGKKIIVK